MYTREEAKNKLLEWIDDNTRTSRYKYFTVVNKEHRWIILDGNRTIIEEFLFMEPGDLYGCKCSGDHDYVPRYFSYISEEGKPIFTEYSSLIGNKNNGYPWPQYYLLCKKQNFEINK